ncbi:hypothetical protein ATN83_1220 [Raoultella ornithinolytica]|nr:hypothetical protein ATN83_1220 [Raoultella ornithinolytica]
MSGRFFSIPPVTATHPDVRMIHNNLMKNSNLSLDIFSDEQYINSL